MINGNLENPKYQKRVYTGVPQIVLLWLEEMWLGKIGVSGLLISLKHASLCIIDFMDMSLSQLRERVDREVWSAEVHGVSKICT